MPYRKLKVYQKGYQLALDVHKLTLSFPKMEQYELASQLRRATRSIVANIVEGIGKLDTHKEILRFLRISMGSCDESRLWLEFAKDLGYVELNTQTELDKRYEEISKMLKGMMNYYASKQKVSCS